MHILLVALLACSTASEPSAASGAKPAEAAAPSKDPVTVSAEGTSFDPPVHTDAIPEGAWYCDMGTVHYARSEEGDGRCARCRMKLKHKAGAPPAAEVAPADGAAPADGTAPAATPATPAAPADTTTAGEPPAADAPPAKDPHAGH